MLSKKRLQSIFSSPWIIGLIGLMIFLLTHGYRFAWDDHSHEIPLLKSFIDSALYPNDFFIQALKAHQTTYFFKGLGLFISTEMVEPTYLVLFCISRYLLFFWLYKFWRFITKSRTMGMLGVLGGIVFVREPQFLNLTFSHMEFTLPLVIAGFYYLYRNKFLLSAFLLGIATNLHAIYGVFVAMYLFGYLLISIKEHGFKIFHQVRRDLCFMRHSVYCPLRANGFLQCFCRDDGR